MILGIIAMIFAVLNVSKTGTRKYKKYMVLSLAFTALALCYFHSEIVFRLNDETFLEDVVVPEGDILPFMAISSVVINSIPLIVDLIKEKTGGHEDA